MARPTLRRLRSLATLAGLILASAPPAPGQDSEGKDDDGSFGFSTPIACREIKGYENYVPLSEPALTSDDKLLVYFRPRHYKSVKKGDAYEAHFTQDGRIRRKGEKLVLWSKKNLLDYTPRSDTPPRLVYVRNSISLKALKPGEYEYDVILRDEVGRSAAAVRSLPFRVVPSGLGAGEKTKGEPGRPDSP